MKKLQFKCTLQSDLIFNQKTATEGNQQTLDYIPGSAFLGLVAGKLYNSQGFPSLEVFHSGKVQFGDAHPLILDNRSYRIPAWWYYPKGGGLEDGIYTPYFHDPASRLQTKQCRNKFASFKEDGKTFIEYDQDTRFAIKSAYDSDKRRSEDAKMYGYQSLVKGSVWCFEIAFDESMDGAMEKVREALIGEKSIGKSKSAEYGLVTIEESSFKKFDIKRTEFGDCCLLYAESRLAFYDKNGQPTFCPEPSQLGIEDGVIDWTHSQIRTFQYAPYNGKRQSRDAERFGIEKGSVICIKKQGEKAIKFTGIENGIGYFKSEGFGRVLIDPAFLQSDTEEKIVWTKAETFKYEKALKEGELSEEEKNIIAYLNKASNIEKRYQIIYKEVNKFVEANYRSFQKEQFASQWGTIRTIAMQSVSKQDILKNLFGSGGFLMHGIASERWKEKGRMKKLEAFINNLNEANVIEGVINLSSEMAKKCRKEGQ